MHIALVFEDGIEEMEVWGKNGSFRDPVTQGN